MSAQTVLEGEDAVRAAIGSHLGTTDWFEITAARLQEFADATGDPDATYFAVSLSNMFLPQIVEVRGFAMGVNYGTETVRIGTAPLAGSRVRGRASLGDVIEVKGGIQTRMTVTVEVDGGEPACVIESLSRWLT
ncbi:MAG TPA: hypothetical protein VGM78_05135 [Ilumatobacteraceae bacterium]|jgi:acyl dehydratase